MATSQKKKTSSTGTQSKARAKSAGTSGKKSANARQPERTRQDVFADGIMLLVVVCVMLFIMFCNIGLCGLAGKFVSGFLFGLFGAVQYVIPIAVCIAVAFAVAYNYSGFIIRKISMSAVVLLLLCAVAHMCVHIDWGFEQIGQSYLYSSENHAAGGFFGALITSIFYPLLSKSGTWLLMIVALLILLLLIAGSSVVDVVKSIAAWYDMDEEELVAREEYRNRRREHNEAKQQERKQVRKHRLEEAARREEEELSQVRARQLNRRERLEQGGFIGMDGHSIRLTDGDVGEEQVLSDKGLTEREESAGETALATGQKTAKRTANEDKRQTQTDLSGGALTADSTNTVSIARDGELRITGLVGEDEETLGAQADARQPYGGSMIAANEPSTHADKAFANPANAVKVTETTAEFVREDLEPQKTVVRDTVGTAAADLPADTEPAKASKRRTRATAQEAAEQAVQTAQEIAQQGDNLAGERYERPLLTLLSRGARAKGNSKAQLQATAKKLEDTLDSFGVHVTVTDVSCGPAVTRYEMMPEQGTRVSKITGLADDIKLNLAVADIRMEAPIPGKAAIGIEVPNKEASAVAFRDLLEDSDFMQQESDLAFAVGKDIAGKVVISDIAKMPHVLIAGATGSGKSVCINTLIMSLLYKSHPDDVKLIMIDPKVVELSVYNGIPHLLIPVVTDPKKASGALNWAVAEMEARYKKFAEYNVRNLEGYNKKVDSLTAKGENPDGEIKRMPKIVIIVDELADLMMVAHGEVEDAIVRLSQLARAAGIHLVIATQRPSVDVITGLIKANVPSRIAFAVSSGVDSRTILDMNGAEKLLGKGDMLFAPSGYPKPVRVQGAFVSDKEVSKVVEFLKAQDLNVKYNDNITREINCGPQSVRDANKGQERDEYFVDAGKFIIEKEKASIGMLQRMYKIGFNRAARIMDQLSEAGVVGPEVGTKPRDILMSMEEFENFLEQGL